MSDKLNEIQPGKKLSDEDKAKLAKSNEKATSEAHRLAAEHRARDMQSGGTEQPVITTVADSIKQKLQKEEFNAPPTPPTETQ